MGKMPLINMGESENGVIEITLIKGKWKRKQ